MGNLELPQDPNLRGTTDPHRVFSLAVKHLQDPIGRAPHADPSSDRRRVDRWNTRKPSRFRRGFSAGWELRLQR
jgi:hypothetical protein